MEMVAETFSSRVFSSFWLLGSWALGLRWERKVSPDSRTRGLLSLQPESGVRCARGCDSGSAYSHHKSLSQFSLEKDLTTELHPSSALCHPKVYNHTYGRHSRA